MAKPFTPKHVANNKSTDAKAAAFDFSQRPAEKAHAARAAKFVTPKAASRLTHLAPPPGRRSSMPTAADGVTHHKTKSADAIVRADTPGWTYTYRDSEVKHFFEQGLLTPAKVAAAEAASPKKESPAPLISPRAFETPSQTQEGIIMEEDLTEEIETARLTMLTQPVAAPVPARIPMPLPDSDTDQTIMIEEMHEPDMNMARPALPTTDAAAGLRLVGIFVPPRVEKLLITQVMQREHLSPTH